MDFKAVVEVLKGNLLEHKDKKIYRDLTVLEVARKVYEGLLSERLSDQEENELRDMLMTLY
jgi:3-methyladenine DNA glycosylase/8-oxoguanine DNA glycosylase